MSVELQGRVLLLLKPGEEVWRWRWHHPLEQVTAQGTDQDVGLARAMVLAHVLALEKQPALAPVCCPFWVASALLLFSIPNANIPSLLYCRASCPLPPPLTYLSCSHLETFSSLSVFWVSLWSVCWCWVSRAQTRVNCTYPKPFPALVTVWSMWGWEEGWFTLSREVLWVFSWYWRCLIES